MSKKSQRRRADRRREEQQKQNQQQNQIITIVAGILLVAVVGFIVWQISQASQDDTGAVAEASGSCVSSDPDGTRPLAALEPAARNGYYTEYPDMTLDTSKDYEAVISVFGKGDMRLALYDDEAPLTVNNFIFLADQGFYDCVPFHRVMQDFMAQGGDPSGSGAGGPGYQFADETDNGIVFDRTGLLAMANSGANTNGSQFFITFVETSWLNGAHTIFGEIIDGEDVLNSITLTDQPTYTGVPDIIERIDIEES